MVLPRRYGAEKSIIDSAGNKIEMYFVTNKKSMTAETISKYYKWLSLVTLALSIVGPMTLMEGTIGEKLWIGLLLNGQFHLAFQFISKVPFRTYQRMEEFNPQKPLVGKVMTGFSLFIMIAPILPLK